MRWDDLFEDLEAQAEHGRREDLAAEVADRTAREEATVALADRLRAATAEVTWVLHDGWAVTGAVLGAGPGWSLVGERDGRQVLVPTHAVALLRGVPAHSAAPAGPVAARRTFLMAVRALAGARERVTVRTTAGAVPGTIRRVCADHLDVEDGAGARTIPFGAVLAVLERG
ncbi:hypothetical protein [Kineococcus sp. SYSU DK002]|uniref:hypothetical protein n=1 Tax=Kineococcus sp. SYSU DK002 TaxID=3383123 RepID=UPI003D7CC7D7